MAANSKTGTLKKAFNVLSRHTDRQRWLNLALQGGGAHGAFTWGVLDRFLEPQEIEFSGVSGTSAGAINAVALAAGYMEAGAEGARRKLATVWRAIGDTGNFFPSNGDGKGKSALGAIGDDLPFHHLLRLLTGVFSPYELNPFEIDPLRRVLDQHIDFSGLRRTPALTLFINATEVSTGRGRVFTAEEVTLDAVLASVCLPSLRHAVKIGRHYYWDGAFSANPALLPLIEGDSATDTLIVRLVPARAKGLPKKSLDIQHNVSRIIVGQSLRSEISVIETVRRIAKENVGLSGKFGLRLQRHRFHMIDGARYISGLGQASAVVPDQATFTYLCEGGRKTATNWLSRNKGAIGRRSTVDLAASFL